MVKCVLHRLLIIGTNHYKTHAVSSSLTNDGRVSIIVQDLLEFVVDIWFIGGHTYKTESQADSVLDALVLTTISITVKEIVYQVLRPLILVDQTIGEIGSSTRVGRILLLRRAMEVWVQNLHCFGFVASVDQTQRSSCVESIPVTGLRDPLEVVLQEGVVGGVCVHHGI